MDELAKITSNYLIMRKKKIYKSIFKRRKLKVEVKDTVKTERLEDRKKEVEAFINVFCDTWKIVG